MNITRIGLVSLIVGLILLMNASSSHVSGRLSVSYGELDEGESQSYVILTAPVGPANMCIGLRQSSPHSADMPPGFNQYDLTDVPVHVKFIDLNNNTIAEKDVITPYCFDVTFNERGAYNVYVTNNGNATTTMPLGIIFDFHNPENREADKYMLSIVLTALGAAITAAGFVITFVSKHSKQHKP
ncbi:MAG: hypothetical protein PVH73_04230 [Candidatus Bathyarchaeota archaeon]